jgi:hypothetical protein
MSARLDLDLLRFITKIKKCDSDDAKSVRLTSAHTAVYRTVSPCGQLLVAVAAKISLGRIHFYYLSVI